MLRVIQEVQPSWIVGENVYGLVNWSGGLVFDQVQADLESEGYEVWSVILPACAVNAPHRRDRVWIIAHSKHNRYKTRREKETEKDGLQKINREAMESREFNGTNISRITADPNSSGFKDRQCMRPDVPGGCREERDTTFNFSETPISSEDAANTKSSRMEGYRPDREQEPSASIGSGLSGCHYARNDWSEWPTQSPICGRNDGISSRLDGITFPKFRNESIKAYGNAWVPQIAYQLFKIINQLNEEAK